MAKARPKWTRDAAAGIDASRQSAQRAIDELQQAITQMGAQMAVVEWLGEGRGFDSGQSPRVMALGARSSARAAATAVAPVVVHADAVA